jgi:acetyl esterase/lipase
LSPLFGDLTGLPRTMVQAGSDEILRGDAERLVERLEAHGVPVHFRLGRDLWHVWHLFAGLMPEATAAVRELGEFVRTTGHADTSASVG